MPPLPANGASDRLQKTPQMSACQRLWRPSLDTRPIHPPRLLAAAAEEDEEEEEVVMEVVEVVAACHATACSHTLGPS